MFVSQAGSKDGFQDGSQHQQSSDGLTSTILEQLEVLACAEAGNIIPTSLQPAVQHTLDCIRRPYQTPQKPSAASSQTSDISLSDLPAAAQGSASSSLPPGQHQEEAVDLDEAWQYLAELLCEADKWAAGVGQTWLYKLLTEAAHQHMARPEHQSQPSLANQSGEYFDEDDYPSSPGMSHQPVIQQMGLLPHPLGGPPKPDAPAHLSNQPELTQLLRQVLSYHTDKVTTGNCFMQVVKRLVLHLKLRCSLVPTGQSPSQHSPKAVPHTLAGSAAQPAHEVSEELSPQQKSAKQEDLLASTLDPGMASMQSAHSMPPDQASSLFAGSAAPYIDPLASLHPHLMRTSPALDWGKPSQDSAPASDTRLAESDDEEERVLSTGGSSDAAESSVIHHRTQSDPKGLFNSALSTAEISLVDHGNNTQEASKQEAGAGQRAGLAGDGSRALSSVLSTAELTGLYQEGETQEGSIVTRDGIILHDAPVLGRGSPHGPPVLGRDSPHAPPAKPGTFQAWAAPTCVCLAGKLTQPCTPVRKCCCAIAVPHHCTDSCNCSFE